jgi:hypothetical protein
MKAFILAIVIFAAGCGGIQKESKVQLSKCQEDEFRLNGGECQTIDDNQDMQIQSAASNIGPLCNPGYIGVTVETSPPHLVGYCFKWQ